MSYSVFLPYLAVMAITTYLVRMIPLVLIKKKIENKYILSFLYYIPYAVLSVMTIPAIFYATESPITAVVGLAVALILGFFGKSLIVVALGASAGVLIAEIVMKFIM